MPDRSPLLDAGPLVVPFTRWPVLAEAARILGKQPRPLDRIAAAHAAGMFEVLALDRRYRRADFEIVIITEFDRD